MAAKEISVITDKKTGDQNPVRDKGLKDAKAKTAVAQTDAIRMKTTDNKEVYIDRNSFVQAMAEVLNSNSQSTITTLFGADANGNHANINMSNLASVLSVWANGVLISDYNDIESTGRFGMFFAMDTRPDTYHPYILHLSYAQLAFGAFGTTTILARSKNVSSWTEWRTI